MRHFLLTILLLSGLSVPALAADMTKEQVEQIVHEYIMKNPKVLIDSVNEYGKAQQELEDQKASAGVGEHMDWLIKNPKHPEAGNPKGDVTIVEFFDYNCGYCKKALTDVMTLLDEDKNLRVVFIDIPILGQTSLEAALWAMASNKQGHYLEYHASLMRHNGPLDEASLADYAKKAGLNVDQLKKDKASPEIAAILDENSNMAGTLGISGTPAFVVGQQMIRGYVGLDGLREAVKQARAKK